jgi:cell division protein FtsL
MYPAFQEFIRDLWQNKPNMIILLIGGVFIFVLLVIDTHLHRKKRKERHRITRFH